MRDRAMTGYTPRRTPGVTPEEILEGRSRVVMCDGGGGALGHPAVALRIEGGEVTCPYCSRSFRLAEDAAGEADHH
ncbi:MAG: zinc-finger domain-containing protein [Acetobacteraceae bacterium]|nr:zinc-finger domain-containing protein [Acetobacteraceae bacterium]MDW8399556.1 zinc-finger domain-containing protein [Acetobacteraceae bacterium]